MANKNSSKAKKVKISIARLILFVLAVFIIGRAGVGIIFKHPKTEIVKYGEIQVSDNVTGYIIKDETLLNSPASGELEIKVSEGTRVQKGVTVASIYTTSNEVFNSKIKAVDGQIAQIKSNSKNMGVFQGDTQKLEQDISDKMKIVTSISKNGDVEKLSELKAQINDLISKKLTISGEQGPSGSNLQDKLKERSAYVNQMNSSKVDIPTSNTGILSYKIDGFEKYFSLSNLGAITVNDLDKLIINDNIEGLKKAQAGQPVVKIINNFEWYILCIAQTDKVKALKQNDKLYITLNDGTKISAGVYNIKNDEKGKSLLTLSLTTNLEQFYSLRKVKLDLVFHDYKGLKIPTSSIMYKGEKRGVMVINKGITKFKEVDLIGFDNDFAIIEEEDSISDKKGLRLYDEVVTNPRFVSEGTLIK